jgi:hypothetical protein
VPQNFVGALKTAHLNLGTSIGRRFRVHFDEAPGLDVIHESMDGDVLGNGGRAFDDLDILTDAAVQVRKRQEVRNVGVLSEPLLEQLVDVVIPAGEKDFLN